MSDVASSVTEALKACSDAGMGGAMIPQITAAADALRECDVRSVLSAAASLSDAADQLSALAALPHGQMTKVAAFIAIADKALATSTQKIDVWLKNSLGGAGKQVLQVREQIGNDLMQMTSDLRSLSGGGG